MSLFLVGRSSVAVVELRRVRRGLEAIRRDNAVLAVELGRKMALLFALWNDQFALRY